MPPKKSEGNKRRGTAENEGPSARRSRRRLAENLEQGAESSDTSSNVSSPESVQSLASTSTSEVTEELPATPAVTAVDTPSTSNPSATPALPSSSETATTLAEGMTNEAGPQTSGTLNELVGGFDPNRFIFRVRPELICSICRCVLKNPRLCARENGEHRFCFQCISQSLVNSPACPECRQPLTLETLKLPQSFLKTVLSEQIIKCDHIERGCPKQVELGNLEDHVKSCEFRPVLCENCGLHVNAKDNDNHQMFCKNDGTNVELKKKIDELKLSQDELKKHVLQVAGKQDEMEVIQKALDEIKQTQSENNEKAEVTEDILELMKLQLERFEGLLGHLFQENIFNRNGAQAMDPTIPTNNQDVIIVGGWYGPAYTPASNTVEKYNIVEKRSTMLPPLNHPHVESAASCVYNNDVLVVGGSDGNESTDTIEVLKMNQHPLRWTIFDGKLPVKLNSHDVIVYQGKLYIIGGYDGNERESSNAIYEIALTPPYTAKLLTRMPEPRRNHRAELVNGKLFILGGTTNVLSKDALDSVVVYDFLKNEFKPYPSLPQPVSRMSTVTWGNMIILVGGEDKNEDPLSDVFMYDTETGQNKPLPSMIYRRSDSSAVIMNDVIVVFGGINNEQRYLNSVESFTIGGDGWEELPGMIEKRWSATAVVKPHI